MSLMRVKKIYFGLPAYNEEESIEPLFKKILQLKNTLPNELEVVFYDDGCTDGTRQAVEKWRDKIPIAYLDGGVNKGLGTAVNQLISYFMKHASSTDGLIIMDCDDTHDPAQVPEMIRKLNKNQGIEVVIASRYQKGAHIKGVPVHRLIMSVIAALLYKTIHPIRRVRDFTCGYRLYAQPALARAASLYSEPLLKERGFACMVELLLKVRSTGTQMAEVPLLLRYDNKRSASKMDVSGNAFRLLRKLLDWRIRGFQ